MADEKQEPQATEEEAPEEEAASKSAASDLGDELMDLFSEDEETNEELLILTRGLPEVEMSDLIGQLREVGDLVRQRKTT